MHEGGALSWRDVLDSYHSRLVDELSASLDSQLRDAVSQAVAAERSQSRKQMETLNQVVRRFRGAGEDQVLPLVAEGCAPNAGKLVVLVFESHQARAVAGFGLSSGNFCFDTSSAPAIVSAIESRDPVVALVTDDEISPTLSQAFGFATAPESGYKAYLFPIIARHNVVAMLVASEVAAWSPIELLCEAAGMRLEAVSPEQRSSAVSAAPATATCSWDSLTADDQKLHLQAQRMARLRVAEMRLYHENELKNGVAGGDIYTALQTQIDSARDQFRESFLRKSPTMVDYLHLEILRSLAQDDDHLLGRHYPGPMV